MEPTLHTAIIGTSSVYGVRELHSMKNVATFDAGNADAAIDPTTLRFVDDANAAVRALHLLNPLEAPDFILKTEGYGIIAEQKYAIDFRTLRLLSRIECEAEVFRLAGSPGFEKTASGVSMQLLKEKGVLTISDLRQVPYVIEDRKRLVAWATFAAQSIQIQKSIFDEVFKLINIASDIASGAAVVTIPAAVIAVANLVQVFTSLAILIQKQIQLIKDNRELFIPPVRYHYGINFYQYLLKGTNYLGLDLELGDDLKSLLSRITLLPSKSDEVGNKTELPVSSLDFSLNTIPIIGDGLLRPSDFGYTLGEAFELVKILVSAKSAVKDGVYHLRAKKDPFWLNTPTFVLPDVLIGQEMDHNNGSVTYNYEELLSRYLISYEKDETDHFTLTDVNNRMAEVIYDHPVTDKKRSLLRGIEEVNIPYSLCVRKGPYDGIYSNIFNNVVEIVNSFQDQIKVVTDSYPALQQVAAAVLEKLNLEKWIQEGALLVENHWFGKPKIVLQDPETGRIPADFASEIGADALWINWQSWNSFAQGWKNPDKPTDTNQKLIFTNVTIPFGVKDWQKTIVNSQLFVPNYGPGEFTAIRWENGADKAECDFFTYKLWAPNLTAKLYKIDTTNTQKP